MSSRELNRKVNFGITQLSHINIHFYGFKISDYLCKKKRRKNKKIILFLISLLLF